MYPLQIAKLARLKCSKDHGRKAKKCRKNAFNTIVQNYKM